MVEMTIKQLKDVIEEMKSIYPFDDEKTHITTRDVRTCVNNRLTISTTDEKTGISILMDKPIK